MMSYEIDLLRRVAELEDQVGRLRAFTENIQVVPPLHSEDTSGYGLVLSVDGINPQTPSGVILHSNNYTQFPGSALAISYSLIVIDTDGYFDSGSPAVVTVPATGLYIAGFTCNFTPQPSTPGRALLSLYIGGGGSLGPNVINAGGEWSLPIVEVQGLSAIGIAFLNAGDQITTFGSATAAIVQGLVDFQLWVARIALSG